jgi:hypothetical protein
MKKTMGIMAVLLLLAGAAPALAANACRVNGDLAKDGNLMIDVSWTIDTAKYKGQTQEQIREAVYHEVWKNLKPQLAKKSAGLPVSYDRSQFTKVSEEKNLVEQRPDGTKVFDYKARVRFNYASAPDAKPEPSEKAAQDNMEKEWHYRFVNEGRD